MIFFFQEEKMAGAFLGMLSEGHGAQGKRLKWWTQKCRMANMDGSEHAQFRVIKMGDIKSSGHTKFNTIISHVFARKF